MKKFSVLLVTVFLVLGFASASGDHAGGHQNSDASQGIPSSVDVPSNVPSGGVSGGVSKALPLPEAASDTASQVLNVIVDTPTKAIGDALQGIFGGGSQGNQTSQQ